MAVIISNNVWNKISDYTTALTSYPITSTRLTEKVDDMINTLNGLDKSIAVPPICMNASLGQTFDSSGKPMNQNLRRFNYQDKSGFQWAFACHYFDNEEEVTIIIVEMMAAIHVTESLEKMIRPIMEFMQRLSAVR